MKARDAKEAAVPPGALLDESERVELVRLRAEIKNAKSENAQLLMQVDFEKSSDLVRERQAVKFAAIADWADRKLVGYSIADHTQTKVVTSG